MKIAKLIAAAVLALGAVAGCGSSARTTRYIDYAPNPPNGLRIHQAGVICSYGPAKKRKQLGDYCDPILFQNKVGLPPTLARKRGTS